MALMVTVPAVRLMTPVEAHEPALVTKKSFSATSDPTEPSKRSCPDPAVICMERAVPSLLSVPRKERELSAVTPLRSKTASAPKITEPSKVAVWDPPLA